jgi:hypothetical protein
MQILTTEFQTISMFWFRKLGYSANATWRHSALRSATEVRCPSDTFLKH